MGILISLAFSLVLSMAGDPFRVLTPGDPLGAGEGPFNAQWHNMATEAIRVSQRATPPGMTPREVVKERDTDVWIANITEADIDEYRPAGLGDLAIYPSENGDFRERLCFLTQKLKSGRPFGIVQEPVGAGKLYACKLAAGPGGQPPNKKWMRLVGDPEPWDVLRTYVLGEQVIYIGPASPWTSGQSYIVGDLVDAGSIVYRCVSAHVASSGNAPPDADHWEVYAGKQYIALLKHSGRVPPTNASYWLASGAHRGIWNKGDTYAAGDIVVEPQLGRIVVDGVSRAWLNVQQAAHQHARIVNGELQSAEEGPVDILWRQGGFGNQWAVVRLCCDSLTLPTANGDAGLTIPVMLCDGVGSYIFRPGGALMMGAMTCVGTGTHSYPARTGIGSLALGVMWSSGNGNFYAPTPSGSLYAPPMTLAGAGSRTLPPTGNGNLNAGAMTSIGFGTRSAPTRTASGMLVLAPLVLSSSSGTYSNTAMFVAKISNPLFDATTGRWVYDWIEQTINTSTGAYQDLAGGKAGNTSSGPFMRERNNNLVKTPLFSLARLRGPWSGQPLYDFEHCCTDGAETASGSLMLGSMICDGDGTFTPPPPKVGSGTLLLGAMTCAGTGYASASSVNVGAGTPELGAMVCMAKGLSSAFSVHLGIGKPLCSGMLLVGTGTADAPVFAGTGAGLAGTMSCVGSGLSSDFSVSIGNGVVQNGTMICAGLGTFLAPVYSGNAALQCGSMVCVGAGLASAESVSIGTCTLQLSAMLCTASGQFTPKRIGTGNLQLAAMLLNGAAEAWLDTFEVSEGGVAAGGIHQVLADIGTDGGVAAGGSHQVLADLGTDGGVAPGGSHQVLADLGTDGGVATGGND